MSRSTLLEAPTQATAVSLADLIVTRLLPDPKSVAPKKLRDDLAVFFRRPPSAEHIAEALAELRADGFVTAKGQSLTDAGRARALQFLNLDALPPKTNWAAVKARHLVPRALGLSPDSDDAAALAKGDKLAALLLKRKLNLPVGTGGTLNAVLEAILCRELGYPDHATLASLKPLLYAKAIGSTEPIEVDAEKVLPRVLLNAKRGGLDGLRDAALAGWADGEGDRLPERAPQEPDEPFDLETFANNVRSEARVCPTGRTGDNKVLINHVWKQLRDEPRFAPLGLAGFKEKLVEANRENRLALARADLVQLMDPADVAASETKYLTAEFHCILIEKA